jgi:hypothetical protein
MTQPEGLPPEAVAILRSWCRQHPGIVAWCGAHCERPGAYPVDAFLLLHETDEEARGRLALDFHDYLRRLRVPAEAKGIFPQLHLSREEYLEDLALLGIAETDVRPVWPETP